MLLWAAKRSGAGGRPALAEVAVGAGRSICSGGRAVTVIDDEATAKLTREAALFNSTTDDGTSLDDDDKGADSVAVDLTNVTGVRDTTHDALLDNKFDIACERTAGICETDADVLPTDTLGILELTV